LTGITSRGLIVLMFMLWRHFIASRQKEKPMAGTRTAPDVTGAITAKQLSVHFVDISGDVWSESYLLPAASTNAQVEAYVDAVQAGSAASIYKIEVNSVYGTDALADSSNAQNDGEVKGASVFDKLNVTLKHTTDPEKKNKIVSVPAPLAILFTRNPAAAPYDFISDTIDGGSAELAAILAAALTMFGAGWAIAWARYVEHVEVNERTRI
jgi:hypothetical protein